MPPPARWYCYGAFWEGGVMSVLCRVCHVFPPLVSLFGLFPVLVSCDLWVNSCPAVFVSLSMIILCIYSPVYSVWFVLVYSLVPSVPVCVSLALSCPALFGVIKDCHLSYILISGFLPCVCTVTYQFWKINTKIGLKMKSIVIPQYKCYSGLLLTFLPLHDPTTSHFINVKGNSIAKLENVIHRAVLSSSSLHTWKNDMNKEKMETGLCTLTQPYQYHWCFMHVWC